jgi:hypothetical protein
MPSNTGVTHRARYFGRFNPSSTIAAESADRWSALALAKQRRSRHYDRETVRLA